MDAKRYLDEQSYTFTEYDVVNDLPARAEMIKISKQGGVPVIEINGYITVGFNPEEIEKLVATPPKKKGFWDWLEKKRKDFGIE